jgi:hypothetical protein
MPGTIPQSAHYEEGLFVERTARKIKQNWRDLALKINQTLPI